MDLKESGEIGAAMTCPLTGELMRDPVIDADGNSFERANILVWLKDRGRSPITNRVMTKDELRPNTILRETIERKREEARRQKALEDASHGWQYDKDPDLSGIPVDVNTETTASKEKPRSSLLRWLSGGSSSSASGTKEATASSTRSFADVEKEAATRRREQNELEKKRAKKKKAQRQGVQFAMDRQSIASGGGIEQLHDLDSAVGSSESGSSSLGTGEQNRSHSRSSETDNLVSAPFEGVMSLSADARQRAPAPPSSDGGSDDHMGMSVESREEEKEKEKGKERERMKTKKKKKAMITDPVDISDNASVASHVSSVSEASERERMKVAKRKKKKKAEKALVGEGSGGSGYGATVSLSAGPGPSRGDSRRGRWRSAGAGAGAGAGADMSPPRSLSPFDLPGELGLSQRDVCTSTTGWLLAVLCCPLPRLPPSDRPLAQHNLLRYWNLHISAPEVINASLLSPFWARALSCLTVAHGDACRECGGSGDGSYVSENTRDGEALFSNETGEGTRGYGTGTPPTLQPRQTQAQGRGNPGGGRITPGGKVSREDVQRTPNNSHQAAPSALRGGARELSLFYAVSSLLSSAEDTAGYDSASVKEGEGEGGDEGREQQVDLLVEALRGLALAWLHLLTVTALLCWSADGFSLWLRDTLSSGTLLTRVLLRLLLPTAGSASAVLRETSLYIESTQSSVSVSVSASVNVSGGSDGGSGGIVSQGEDNVPSLQAMLSFMSLADGLPLALLLFTTGYAALRAYRYTVLARAEVVRQAHKKSALAFASAYLDARAVDSKQVAEAKVTGVDSDEEDGSVATITYKGQRITLPRDVAETADLESLGASISPPPPNQHQHHHDHQQHQQHQHLLLQKGRAAGGALSSGGGGASAAAGAASRGMEPPLPLSYRHTDLLGMALAAAAPTYYALLGLSLLCLIGGTSGSALGPFSSLYWRDCGATWWAAVVPLPLSNLVPLFTSSSPSLLVLLETLYTGAVDSAVESLSSAEARSWGFELSPLLLDQALHTALAGAHLAAGLCAQVGALALGIVAGLCYAEKAFLAVLGLRAPSSRETSHMAERSGPGVGMGGLPHRVVGHASFWRAALACAVVLVLVIRALAASAVISATGAQAQLLGVDASLAWPDSTLAPLSTNSIFLARVVYAPWCRLDAAALGILFYLVSMPGGLSLRSTQARSTAGSGSDSVVDGGGRARSYRAALLLSYGAFEGPYNSPDASRSCDFNRPPSLKAPFGQGREEGEALPLTRAEAGQDALIDTVLGLHSTSADSDDEEDGTPGTLTSLLAERDRERALLANPPNKVAASAAASLGPRSVHSTSGETDDSTIGTFATDTTSLPTTTLTTSSVDEAWYSRDPYSLGDGYRVRRVDVAPAERLTGVSREDVLVGRRAGISAPKGVRFAHPGGRGRESIHGGVGGEAEAEVDSWGRDSGGGDSRGFMASISRGLSAALGWVSSIATGSKNRHGYGIGDDDTDEDEDEDDEEVGLLGGGRDRGRGRGGSYTVGEQHRKKQGQQRRTRLLAIEILLARERRALLLARLGKVLMSTTLLVLTAAHFMSTQESVWFQWALRALRVASRDEVAHSLSAEFAFRFLSQCLAPVAALCLAHLASSPGWHNPAHYLLCHVLIRNPLFTLLGRLSVPFLLFHPLVAAVTLRSGLLVRSTLTSTGVSSGTEISTTTYAYTWGSNGVPALFCLYFTSLAAAAAVSLVVALLVERPLWRYCKDNLMERFGVARQFREFL